MNRITDNQNTSIDILIWDSSETPVKSENQKLLLWQDIPCGTELNAISIPLLVEEKAEKLRNQYLAWIYEFGEKQINGKPIIEHLKIRDNLSYWWMTLISQKSSVGKSLQIVHIIRLFAFTDYAENQNIKKIKLFSENNTLAKCCRIWCESKNISFSWNKITVKKKNTSIKKKLSKFYHILYRH